MAKIERAILSCYDKTGIVDLAKMLREFGADIIATTGTFRVLQDAGIEARSIADFTGVAEMLDGRVKSLHPRVHAGLLGIRDNKLHAEQMQALDYKWIDFVAVNLHPLDVVAQQAGISVDEVIEQTDIGGTAMIRSAAKNFRYVTVVVNPARYKTIIHEMQALGGAVTFATRYRLAQEAFACTANYDRFLAEYLERSQPPKE
jgi:phosphoribosylaminoimidazolecarboxamide formyltransferase/IMP cyclohydrolase